MPELAKYEEKLIDFANHIEKSNQIIRKFDEELMTKVDKKVFKNLKELFKDQYVNKDDFANLN